MEPSGCNRAQPVASGRRPKTAQTSEKRCRALPPMVRRGSTVRVRQRASLKALQMSLLCCLFWRVLRARVRDGYTCLGLAGTRGQGRRLPSPCDTADRSDRSSLSRESPCMRAVGVALLGKRRDPLPTEGVSGSSPPERSAKAACPRGGRRTGYPGQLTAERGAARGSR